MKRRGYYFLLIGLLCYSCAAHKPLAAGITRHEAHRSNAELEHERSAALSNFVPYTPLSYVERFKGVAIQEMNLYGVPASITLAQGLLESSFGNGDLAKIANNHFGIKCTSDWKGRSYYKNDDQVDDCFRVYDQPEDSYRDHSNFLKRKRYAALFELDKNDYTGWAYGLKAAGYATNPNYPQLLINTIVKYHLDQYDRPETEDQKIKREDRVLTQINQNIGKANDPAPAGTASVPTTTSDKLYTVKQGDTLYNISRRFGITVDQLKAMNNIADNTVKIGQQLVIAQ